jgi:uncharacterized protein (TIGR02284 family)
MAETQRTRGEQDAPTATGGDTTPQTGLDPQARRRGRADEVDQSRGSVPPGGPHPEDTEVRPAGAEDTSARDDDDDDVLIVAEADVVIVDAAAAESDVVIVDTGPADSDLAAADADAGEVEENEGGVTAAQPVDEESINALNDLIHLDIDAIQAYRHAIDACEIAEIRDNLTAFMGDHERHVRDLRDAVRSLGGEPVTGRDVKGFFIEGFTAIVSQGDRSALLAMRGNEELTTRRYDAARNAGLNGAVRPLIEGNYQDEARHLAWIKQAISSRAWDAEPGAKKAA